MGDNFYFNTLKSDKSDSLNASAPTNDVESLRITESNYINRLSELVTKHIPLRFVSENSTKSSHDLTEEKAKIIFGNIEDIYNWHKNEFSIILDRCIKDPSKFGTKIEEIEKHMVHLYVGFFKTKPLSDYILEKHKTLIADSIDIKSYLNLPFDRFFKYHTLFSNLLVHYGPKYEKELTKAIEAIARITSSVHNKQLLWCLEDFPERINDQGELICFGPILCCNNFGKRKSLLSIYRSKKPKLMQVFLLEGCIIIADKKSGICEFEYKFHIRTSRILNVDNLINRIEVKFKDVCNNNVTSSFTFFTEDSEQNKQWMDALRNIKDVQDKFRSNILEPVRG